MVAQFKVPDVSCQHCVNSITSEVATLAGVQNVNVNLNDKTVTVNHTDDVSEDQIVEAIHEAGYDDVTRLN